MPSSAASTNVADSPVPESISADSDDAALQRAATVALGEREGAVMVMDLQTGRLRAVVNPRLAFEQSFPPGSAIKPFTILAALSSGIVTADAAMRCRTPYKHGGFVIACSHPVSRSAFTLQQALAYSCNFCFASLGERLGGSALPATLETFGFGARTGVNAAETAGRIPNGEWHVSEALGEHADLRVTPVQLLSAYVALFNGGHLLRPQIGATGRITAQERKAIPIPVQHRAILMQGLRGAVRYGTAARAGLATLALDIAGKTGTSTSSDGYRTQGWFVAVAVPDGIESAHRNSPGIAVLVFLKRSHGALCAAISRPIFEEYARIVDRSDRSNGASRQSFKQVDGHATGAVIVRVRHVRSGTTVALPLEEYVCGVLRAEAGGENQIEALKAQAVVSRTFALKNLGRHAADGYDFCSTTHCQGFMPPLDEHVAKPLNPAMRKAVDETAGEMLRDAQGGVADVYYHAACGGMTANAGTLWGTTPPSYLLGVRDDYCATMPHRNWHATIPARGLAAALRSDPSSDVGATLDDIVITERDATGRAASITLEGERRRVIRGWTFKLIVGRVLGWNLLKSSRFDVRRSGADFVFNGSGFGHGVGLCQEGAHVMARQGIEYWKILAHYFPGTSVSVAAHSAIAAPHDGIGAAPRIVDDVPGAPVALVYSLFAPARNSGRSATDIASEHFRVRCAPSVDGNDGAFALRVLEAARSDVRQRLQSAGVSCPELKPIVVVLHGTTQAFVAATGQPAWTAALTHDGTIEMQPPRTLRRRGVFTTTLRHEYVHSVIETLSRGHAPHWLCEGLAACVAGEARMLVRFDATPRLAMDDLERRLSRPGSMKEMRSLYAAACGEVRGLIRTGGEAALWKRVKQ